MLIKNIFKLLITQLLQPVLLHYFDFVGEHMAWHFAWMGYGKVVQPMNQWT